MARTVSLSIAFALCLALSPNARAESMQDRVCSRVVKHYDTDGATWDRVNDRIEQRFGFRCTPPRDRDNSQFRPSIISKPSQTGPAASPPKVVRCSQLDYSCTPWSACNDGTSRRTCSLKSTTCYGTYPMEIQRTCLDSQWFEQQRQQAQKATNAKLERWRTIHQDMIGRARDFVDQRARECAKQVADIESDFVLRFNEYVRFLNGEISIDPHEAEEIIEGIIDEWEKLPIVCY